MASAPMQDLHDFITVPSTPPLLIDGRNRGWIPQADGVTANSWFIYRGVRLSHWPMPELDGVAIHVLGGTEDEAGFEPEGVLVTLTRSGLQAWIRDLQAIDANWDGTA